MISHEHKCIFIHISKCAGSSVENAFGIDLKNISEENNKYLFGWNPKHEIFLHHATPQQLFEYGLIDKNVWKEYFKFIIVRNPWERALSDYIWLSKQKGIRDSFSNFLNRSGKFSKVLLKKDINYRGDHLKTQKSYFFYNGEELNYDKVIRFEELGQKLKSVSRILRLPKDFFQLKVNTGDKIFSHYSKFYTKPRRKILEKRFSCDIDFLDYQFEDKRKLIDYVRYIKSSKNIIK